MANLKKYTLKQLGRVSKEAYREIEKSTYKNFVDPSKSENNFSYNFKSSKDMMREMRRRINEILDGQIIKDGTKVGSWIFTCPQELLGDEKQEKKYFDVSKRFCEKRYGKENVIDCVIHRDETTPHMTVYVVPEAVSRKTGRLTVSTASCFTRKDLQSFHPDFEKVLQKEFGMKGLGLNGKTKKNRNIDDLKYDTVEALREENAALRAENEELSSQVKELQDRLFRLSEKYSQPPFPDVVEEEPEKASETLPNASETVRTQEKTEEVLRGSESHQKPQYFRPQKASMFFSYLRAEEKGDAEVMKHTQKMYETYFPESKFETEYESYKHDQREKRVRQSSTIIIRTDDRQGDYQRQ